MKRRASRGLPGGPAVRRAAESLVGCVQRLHTRGLCDGTAGNCSVVVQREPLRLVVTPSGLDKGRLAVRDLLVVGEDGRTLAGAAGRPSAETPLHLALVRAAAAGAVLHTHSVWGTLVGQHFRGRGGFDLDGYEMLKGLDGVESHEEPVFVPVVPNSQDPAALATSLASAVEAHPRARGLLIAGHGLYAWGRDLHQAERHVEIYEFLFQLAGRRLPLVRFEG